MTGAHGRHVDEGWTPRLEIKGWMRDYDQLTTLLLMQPKVTHPHNKMLFPSAGGQAGRSTNARTPRLRPAKLLKGAQSRQRSCNNAAHFRQRSAEARGKSGNEVAKKREKNVSTKAAKTRGKKRQTATKNVMMSRRMQGKRRGKLAAIARRWRGNGSAGVPQKSAAKSATMPFLVVFWSRRGRF